MNALTTSIPQTEVQMQTRGKKPVCISFTSPLDNVTASALMGAIAQSLNNGHDDLHLMLSTPGGSVADGIAVYNFLRALPVHVTSYNIGTVDSIGNVIFQGARHRVAFPTSRFMFHGVGFEVQKAQFALKDVRERVSSIENDQGMIADILVRHTQLSAADVEALFLDAAFIRSLDAKERGIVDEVADVHLPKGMPVLQLVFQR